MGHILLTSLTLASLIADAQHRFEAALVLLIAAVAWVVLSTPIALLRLTHEETRPIALRIAGGHFALLSSFSHWSLLQENGGNPALSAGLAFSFVGLILSLSSGLLRSRLGRRLSRNHRNGS